MRLDAAVVRGVAYAALTCAVASCSGTEDPNGGPAFTNSIVFVSDRNREEQLYTMRSDGSNVKPLTTVFGYKYAPAFSPNGKRIAFAMTDGASSNVWIYVIDADGTGLMQLTSGVEQDLNPSWSPDGSQIAFESDRARGIFIMNADGSGQHALNADTELNVSPSWSPSANEILFERGPYGDVYETTSTGDSTRFLVRGSWPEWSPSGTQFLFYCGLRVCVSRARDASAIDTIRQAMELPYEYMGPPKWSPDEHRFAYVRQDENSRGKISIWTASTADGSFAVQITPDSAGHNWAPDWTRH
jgi:Tol biopolymer transport system component